MNENDEKIKELLGKVEIKIKELGCCPKLNLKTNGIFKNGSTSANINCATIEQLVDVVVHMQMRNNARKTLGLESQVKDNDWIHDCIQRVEQIKWQENFARLNDKQKQLKSLISEDVKTANLLSEIECDI